MFYYCSVLLRRTEIKIEFGAETEAHYGSKHTHFFLKDNTICQDLAHKGFHMLLFHFLKFMLKSSEIVFQGLKARNHSFYLGYLKNGKG